MRRLWILAVLVLGCSSATDGEPIAPLPSEAPAECKNLIGAICYRRSECSDIGGSPQTVKDCQAALLPPAHCEKAVGISGKYSQCQDDLVSYDCNLLMFGDGSLLPSSCQGAIVMGGSP